MCGNTCGAEIFGLQWTTFKRCLESKYQLQGFLSFSVIAGNQELFTCALSCTVNGGKIVPGADKLQKPGLIISLGAGNSALSLGNGGKVSNSLNLICRQRSAAQLIHGNSGKSCQELATMLTVEFAGKSCREQATRAADYLHTTHWVLSRSFTPLISLKFTDSGLHPLGGRGGGGGLKNRASFIKA
jgi:hypothetical protein